MMVLRARFDGRVLIPTKPIDLPTDRELEVEVTVPTVTPRGSPAAILEVLNRLPRLSREDTEVLERAIKEGQVPVRHEGIFDEPR